jgi:hypothetical protein
MEMLLPPAIVIVLATLVIDRTRAYRVLPAAVNRIRRWRSRAIAGEDGRGEGTGSASPPSTAQPPE